MANWTALKAAVAAVIKTNGNKEITGAVLQTILNSIISNVGANATYKGVAITTTTPGTPDGNEWYFAANSGTYSNFNGYVHDGTEIVVLSNVTGNWVGTKTGIATRNNQLALDEAKISKKKGTNLFNSADFLTGYYIASNGRLSVNAEWGVTGFIPFTQANANVISNFFAVLSSGGYNALYDVNKNFIASFQGNTATWQSNVAYVRFSGTPIVAANTIMVNVGTVLQTLVPYTETFGLVSTESLVDGAITTPKVKDGAITESKVADNTVSTTKVKDGAITPIKADFFQVSKNLFNPNDSGVALGSYVSYFTGKLRANPSYNATGFMPVVGGQNYTMNYKHEMAWYDANKVYISGSPSTDKNLTQQAPANAAYCRCTVITTSWGSFQFELGTQQTDYEPYGFKIKQEYIPESDSFFPNIAMTRKLHILANNENSVYHKSLIERWNPYRYLIQSTGTNWGYYERYSRVNAASAGDITYKIYDGVTLSLKRTKTATVIVGNPATNNGAKIVQVIGDSFSYNGYWFDKTNQLCPDLSFVGMRKSYNTLLKAEGRGGWTLASYMTSKHATNDSFSPFLHPADPYKYYGNTAFWIAVKAGSKDYGIAGFTDIANTIGFNETTGLKAVPEANDVMYNDANARYEVYNGSAWVEISETTLAFTFNYAKYLTTWGITMPDILGIMLGSNDFMTKVLNDSTFATWKTNMDTLLTSVRSAASALGKTVKIAICLPVTETASANNSAFVNPAFRRANMFDARRRIIEAFDNNTYSDNNIDVVDTGTAFDGDFGFAMSEIKPFSDYAGTQREMFSSNVPHPDNAGYSQLGIRFAGYIQSIR